MVLIPSFSSFFISLQNSLLSLLSFSPLSLSSFFNAVSVSLTVCLSLFSLSLSLLSFSNAVSVSLTVCPSLFSLSLSPSRSLFVSISPSLSHLILTLPATTIKWKSTWKPPIPTLTLYQLVHSHLSCDIWQRGEEINLPLQLKSLVPAWQRTKLKISHVILSSAWCSCKQVQICPGQENVRSCLPLYKSKKRQNTVLYLTLVQVFNWLSLFMNTCPFLSCRLCFCTGVQTC